MRRSLVSLAVAACGSVRAPPASCPDGNVLVTSQADVARLAGCRAVAGLAIRPGGPLDTRPLAELRAIAGDLAIGPSVGLDEVALPGLHGVGGTIRVSANGSLRGLFVPALARAGRVEIVGNLELTTFAAPALVEVAGGFVVAGNAELEAIDAVALERVGGEFVIAGHPELALVDMPKLAHGDGARIEDNPKLPAELVGQLTRR
jgi:hypothetical protein